ncbi:MAG: hypothetical protein ABEK84_07325, partial [Salinibacter sp.]
MSPRPGSAPVDQSYSLSLGGQSTVLGRQLGYVIGGTIDRSASFYDDGVTGRYHLAGDTTALTPIIRLRDRKSTIESSLGGIANLTYKLSPNHEIGLHSLYSHTGETTTRLQRGQWSEAGPHDVLTNRTLLFEERDVLSLDLHGTDYFTSLGGTRVTWKAAYASTSQQEPDRRFFASLARVFASGDTIHAAFNQGLREPARLFRTLNERQYSGIFRSASSPTIAPKQPFRSPETPQRTSRRSTWASSARGMELRCSDLRSTTRPLPSTATPESGPSGRATSWRSSPSPSAFGSLGAPGLSRPTSR